MAKTGYVNPHAVAWQVAPHCGASRLAAAVLLRALVDAQYDPEARDWLTGSGAALALMLNVSPAVWSAALDVRARRGV